VLTIRVKLKGRVAFEMLGCHEPSPQGRADAKVGGEGDDAGAGRFGDVAGAVRRTIVDYHNLDS
jgi:hypothetical protein